MPLGKKNCYLNSGLCCSLKLCFPRKDERGGWLTVAGCGATKVKDFGSLTQPAQHRCQWMQRSTALPDWYMDYAQRCGVQKNDTFSPAGWELVIQKRKLVHFFYFATLPFPLKQNYKCSTLHCHKVNILWCCWLFELIKRSGQHWEWGLCVSSHLAGSWESLITWRNSNTPPSTVFFFIATWLTLHLD